MSTVKPEALEKEVSRQLHLVKTDKATETMRQHLKQKEKAVKQKDAMQLA